MRRCHGTQLTVHHPCKYRRAGAVLLKNVGGEGGEAPSLPLDTTLKQSIVVAGPMVRTSTMPPSLLPTLVTLGFNDRPSLDLTMI